MRVITILLPVYLTICEDGREPHGERMVMISPYGPITTALADLPTIPEVRIDIHVSRRETCIQLGMRHNNDGRRGFTELLFIGKPLCALALLSSLHGR